MGAPLGVIQAPEPEPRIIRYELSDHEWSAIKPTLPNKPRGVRGVHDPRVPNGIFWVLRSGAPWRDPKRASAATAEGKRRSGGQREGIDAGVEAAGLLGVADPE